MTLLVVAEKMGGRLHVHSVLMVLDKMSFGTIENLRSTFFLRRGREVDWGVGRAIRGSRTEDYWRAL